MNRLLGLAVLIITSSACGTSWKSNLLVDGRDVARALNDPADLPGRPFDPSTVPEIKFPDGLRPCCAFGMDLKAKGGPIPIPFYENENIRGPSEVGPHAYNNSGKGMKSENNGLVYTCRGGYIDLAHIRDNADRTLYLAMEIARRLPTGFTLELPEEGTKRRIVVKPLPEGLLSSQGRWILATDLAEWANYQLSVWHEVVTWYGWESIKGFSERLSAFSPEDLYSNVIGQKLAGGIVLNRQGSSREQYDKTLDGWIQEALRRLGAVSRDQGRLATQAVDGLWWDSKQRMPENKLVTRRNLHIGFPMNAWLVSDAIPKSKQEPALKQMCAHQAPPLTVEVVDHLGNHKIEDLISVEFEFAGWVPESFAFPVEKGKSVTQAEFPTIMKDIRMRGDKELGPGFDHPNGPAGEPVS